MSLPLLCCEIAAATGWTAAAAAASVALQRCRKYARLRADARMDGGTGLLTMAAWRADAEAELARARRDAGPVAVAMMDIDRFKQVNDTYGHLAGDQVIRACAEAIRRGLRPYDLAGRYGGDEFVILFPQTTASQAASITERLSREISSAPILASTPVTVTVSAGISQLGVTSTGLDELLTAADASLYSSKRAGRCRVQVATSA